MNNKDILVTPVNIQGELIKNETELNDLQFQAFKEQKYNELLKENQQLKKQNARLTREVCNGLIANYDYSSTLKDELNKERINNIVLKEANKITNEENNQLKEVIEQVRETINKMICDGYAENGTYYIFTKENSEFGARAKILLHILDKVRENK